MELALSTEVNIRQVAAQAASAGTTVTSSAIDMQGFDAVLIIAPIVTANAGNYLKAQQSSDDGSVDAYSDIEGSKVIVDANDNLAILNIRRPSKRYLKALVVRGGANTIAGPVIAIRYNARKGLQVNDVANSQNLVELVGPAEGTP
jgi:hypothetical protein